MHQPQRHAQSGRAEMANVVSVVSVVSAMTGASVAAASVDPSAAAARTSSPGLTPMAHLKCNGLMPWQLVPMRLPASNPASSRLRPELDRKSRANGALVGGTVTVGLAQSVASAVTVANAPSALNPQDARKRRPTKSPPASRASLISQRAQPRQTLHLALTSL